MLHSGSRFWRRHRAVILAWKGLCFADGRSCTLSLLQEKPLLCPFDKVKRILKESTKHEKYKDTWQAESLEGLELVELLERRGDLLRDLLLTFLLPSDVEVFLAEDAALGGFSTPSVLDFAGMGTGEFSRDGGLEVECS